ncbi:MAG TPA: acid phosphatase [Candidatus Methylomirabilis sp.]|nr:acid phosphatase [Candidatus Methylomirabilis sp.]
MTSWVRRSLGPAALAVALLVGHAWTAEGGGLEQIDHIVVIYAENRSFDHLYGLFPGAEGIADATAEQRTQLDHDGRPLPHLPPVYTDGKPDARFPRALPNGPFRIDAPPINGRLDQVLPSPWHLFYQSREQINGGKNNMYVAMSNAGAWVMGYFDGSSMKLWQWAREYTLADHFFMGAYGGSFLNHFWLVCACTPRDPNVADARKAQLDERGRLRKKPTSPASVLQGPVEVLDGLATPEGYLVNNAQPPFQPSGIPPAADGSPDVADPSRGPLPAQTVRTIGDTLSAKGITWAWYAGGWDAAVTDGRRPPKETRDVIYNRGPGSPIFVPHHQPFNYFARFAPDRPDRAAHLKDEKEFVAAIEAGTLPQVSFLKPAGRYTAHPSYTDLTSGDDHIAMLLERLRKSPQWPKMAVIVTYDENGGFWDHVPPPSGPGWSDAWGPAARVPAIIVSPFAKRGHVDKTPYDTTSIIKFITRRFALEPLPGAREKMGDLTAAFGF